MKKDLVELKFAHENRPMSVADALACAAKYIRGSNARILAETPEEKPIWRIWNKNEYLNDTLKNCLKLYIFDDNAEIRLHREYSSETGRGRLTYKDENAPSTYARFSEYALRDSKKKLKFAEHFAFDAQSGAMSLKFARFCGVED